jgi:uncharacterized UPF0160 family protein
VHPRSDGDWLLAGVPTVPGEYVLRKDLPGPWGGLTGNQLAEVTGVEDAVFCHSKLFLAVTHTEKGALELSRLALENKPVSDPSCQSTTM